MKRRLICLILALCAFSLASCGHKHHWGEWTVLSAADCENGGSRQRSCACGAVDTELIAATGHDFGDGEQIAASPARPGCTLYTCALCGMERKENLVEPLGSKGLAYEVSADGKTCTVTGLGTCTDTELGIPATIDGYEVTAIANYAFVGQPQLTFLWMAPTVKTVGYMAFANVIGLVSVTLPASLEQIRDDAFLGCEKLIEVINLSKLDVQKGTLANGRVAMWAAEVTGGESHIVEVGDFLFYTHADVKSLVAYVGDSADMVLPKDFRGEGYQIHSYAFSDAANLITSVTFTAPVEIGYYAFKGCEKLEKVEINDLQGWCQTNFVVKESNPLYYAKNLYLNGALLTDAVLPEGTLFIQPNAFINCESLKSISIPKTVLGIGDAAFEGCNALRGVYYGGNEEDWKKIDLGGQNEKLTDAALAFRTDTPSASEIYAPAYY